MSTHNGYGERISIPRNRNRNGVRPNETTAVGRRASLRTESAQHSSSETPERAASGSSSQGWSSGKHRGVARGRSGSSGVRFIHFTDRSRSDHPQVEAERAPCGPARRTSCASSLLRLLPERPSAWAARGRSPPRGIQPTAGLGTISVCVFYQPLGLPRRRARGPRIGEARGAQNLTPVG